jgi:hypothetical protein
MSSCIGGTSSNGGSSVEPADADTYEPDAVDSDEPAGRSVVINPEAEDELVPLKFLL